MAGASSDDPPVPFDVTGDETEPLNYAPVRSKVKPEARELLDNNLEATGHTYIGLDRWLQQHKGYYPDRLSHGHGLFPELYDLEDPKSEGNVFLLTMDSWRFDPTDSTWTPDRSCPRTQRDTMARYIHKRAKQVRKHMKAWRKSQARDTHDEYREMQRRQRAAVALAAQHAAFDEAHRPGQKRKRSSVNRR